MKVYFKRTNGNNLVIITDGETAKIFDAAPSGIYDGIDLYSNDAEELLKKSFAELESSGTLNDYDDIYSSDEMSLDSLVGELSDAVLVFEN